MIFNFSIKFKIRAPEFLPYQNNVYNNKFFAISASDRVFNQAVNDSALLKVTANTASETWVPFSWVIWFGLHPVSISSFLHLSDFILCAHRVNFVHLRVPFKHYSNEHFCVISPYDCFLEMMDSRVQIVRVTNLPQSLCIFPTPFQRP